MPLPCPPGLCCLQSQGSLCLRGCISSSCSPACITTRSHAYGSSCAVGHTAPGGVEVSPTLPSSGAGPPPPHRDAQSVELGPGLCIQGSMRPRGSSGRTQPGSGSHPLMAGQGPLLLGVLFGQVDGWKDRGQASEEPPHRSPCPRMAIPPHSPKSSSGAGHRVLVQKYGVWCSAETGVCGTFWTFPAHPRSRPHPLTPLGRDSAGGV